MFTAWDQCPPGEKDSSACKTLARNGEARKALRLRVYRVIRSICSTCSLVLVILALPDLSHSVALQRESDPATSCRYTTAVDLNTEIAHAQLVQRFMPDGDDARDLIAIVLASTRASAMLGVGLVWAFIRGWQLTLAGLAIAPVFAVTMSVQSSLVARCEARNKRAREEVSRGYYNVSLTTFLPLAR